MGISTAVLAIIVILTLWLALFVYFKNPARWVNRAFSIFSLAVAGWTTGTWGAKFFAESKIAAVFTEIAFAMAALSVYSLVIFFHAFPRTSSFPRSRLVIVLGVLAAMIVATPKSPWIVTNLTVTESGLKTSYGPLYPLFALYILSCIAYSLWIITAKIKATRGIERVQLNYLFAGLLVPGILASVTNLLIPLMFGTSRFSQYGPLFSFIMIAMIAHAIIRHRLMDIRVVIKKSVVYIVAFTVAGVLLTTLIVGSNFLFPDHRWQLAREILLSLLVAVLFYPLKNRIQQAFDRYLYREPYDYQGTIRETSRRMTTILDLRSLLHYVSDVIGRTMHSESATVYLRDGEGSDYRHAVTRIFGEGLTTNQPQIITADSALVMLLCRERTHLLRDDLRREDLDAVSRAGLEGLAGLGSDLALPLLKEDQLTGFLLVGPKRSGDPYFNEDLDLLSTMASQAATAVTNAQLYAEVSIVNEYVQNILKTMESGVIAAGVDGKITLFNTAAERMTSLAAGSLRPTAVSHLPGALADLLQATLADGVPRLQVETMLIGASNQTIPVVCSTSSFADVQGRILGAVLVFSDLTRLKELEGEKRRAERLASLEALASGIAHEIKNPLVAIKAFAQLVPRRFAEEEFRDDFSRVAVREIERINELVERLRVVAAPARPLHPLDLRGPIEEILELLRGQLHERHISVTRLYDEHLPAIMGEAAQLKQLFLNLFQNAIDAMEPGGTLAVGARSRESNGESSVLVEVADTGCGIPEPLLEKIFDPFFSTKPRGTGLGLAICRGIADAHRATIRAENVAGARGATVSLIFRAAPGVHSQVHT